MKTTRRHIIITALAAVAALMTATAAALSAQETGGRTADYTGTHEIELSVGLPAPQFATSLLGMTRGFMNILDMTGDMLGAAAGDGTTAPDPVVYSGSGLTGKIPILRIEYGYNALPWLSAGGGIYYGYDSYPLNYAANGEFAWNENTHCVSIMANLRFYWLNRPALRMYSGLGAGVGIVHTNSLAMDKQESESMRTYATLAFDIRLIGLTVGRKLYGRFELGALGSGLVTAGIGYRF